MVHALMGQQTAVKDAHLVPMAPKLGRKEITHMAIMTLVYHPAFLAQNIHLLMGLVRWVLIKVLKWVSGVIQNVLHALWVSLVVET